MTQKPIHFCSQVTALPASPFLAVQTRTAKVVALDGSLREYSSEVKVLEVLNDRPPPSCFICSSDELYFNTKIPALRSQDSLNLGQLYFILPLSKLEYPLSGSDMAALAIKASLALSAPAPRKQARKQVRPTAAVELAGEDDLRTTTTTTTTAGFSISNADASRRTASKFRLHMRRYSYRRTLSTIEEVVR